MKSVLISTQPKWCELIARAINPVMYSVIKTVEVRKTKPKLETPFKVYIYCTKDKNNTFFPPLTQQVLNNAPKDFVVDRRGNGKVIGEFVCDRIDYWKYYWQPDVMHIQDMSKSSCVSVDELLKYSNNAKDTLYAWHISDFAIYDKPKELSEFIRICPEWEKEEITKKCLKCEHHFISNADCFEGCDCEGELSITRPPQSWCYVEELG